MRLLEWYFWIWAIVIVLTYAFAGKAWGRFALIQCPTFTAMIVGVVLLVFPCYFSAWKSAVATVGPEELTDKWSWPINWIYGNPSKDGVSGQFAKIWDGPNQVSYRPNTGPRLRAWLWNMRNSAGGLKYLFAWEQGPLKSGTWLGGRRTWKVGWQRENGIKVPVMSV